MSDIPESYYNPEIEFSREKTLDKAGYTQLAQHIVENEKLWNLSRSEREQRARSETAHVFFDHVIPDSHESNVGFGLSIAYMENGRRIDHRFPHSEQSTADEPPNEDIPTLIIHDPHRLTEKLTDLVDTAKKSNLYWTMSDIPEGRRITGALARQWSHNENLLETNQEQFLDEVLSVFKDPLMRETLASAIAQSAPDERKQYHALISDAVEQYEGLKRSEQFMKTIWYNATEYDFQHPEQYIDRVTAFLQDNAFEEFDYPGVDVGQIPTFGEEYQTLHVARQQADHSYETPHLLHFKLADKETDSQIELPYIRYALVSSQTPALDGETVEKTAYVYAVQMPKQDEEDKVTAADMKESLELRKVKCVETIKKRYSEHREAFVHVFGEIPEDVLKLDDQQEFVTAFEKHLRATKPLLFSPGLYSYFAEEEEPTKTFQYDNEMWHAFRYISDFQEDTKEYERREKIEKRLKRANRKLYKVNGIPESEELKEYRQAKKQWEESHTPDEPFEESYPEGNVNEVFWLGTSVTHS